MMPRLERAIAEKGPPTLRDLGRAELALAVAQALGPGEGALLVAQDQLKPRVFRLRFALGDRFRSLIAKRMEPAYARRNELVIRRWLPEMELAHLAPGLLGVAAAPDGRWVWHVYEDLGPWELATREPDPVRIAAAVERIASVHARFAGHPLLAEVRLHGQSLGPSYLETNVRDAIQALERVRPPHVEPTAAEEALRDRLLARLHRLRDETWMRNRALAEWGGPETLLHGDLWAINTFVEPSPGGHRVRFIDWDRAGVGPVSYDLSAFLLRFAPAWRPEIVRGYREALGEAGWRVPGRRELNLLCESAECARYANRVIWPALALLRDRAAWGFDALAEVERWFDALEPVLPEEPA